MSGEPRAWVLNLDAEEELARGGGAHTPSAALLSRVEQLVPRLAGLIRPGDTLVFPKVGLPSPRPSPAPGEGVCWCPTRWALEQLDRAGLTRPAAPAMDVLRRVNHRRFAHELGEAFPATGFATTHHELKALLANTAELADVSAEVQWLLKRPFGYAGKGRRKLRPGPVQDADQAWLDASLREGEGLQVEPWVQRELDVALHGYIPVEGRIVWGQPTVQVLDATGAWQSSRVASDGSLTPAEREALETEARRTAEALRSAGYFGPFGIDGFRWVDPRGDRHFRPRCELNARYSMGWAVGLGELRPDR